MSEDRKKVLEMLSDGKITVDEAERLLRALGEGSGASDESTSGAPFGGDSIADDSGDNDSGRRTGRTHRREVTVNLDDIEDQIRSSVEGVRRTVQASMPRLRTVIRDAAPDVERIVEEATSSIPGIVEEVTRAIRDAVGGTRFVDDDQFPARVERQFMEQTPIGSGSEVELHNPKGHIEVVTWDEERIQADVHLTVRSGDEETANARADEVQLLQEPGDGRLTLRPVFERGKEDASYRLDILLHVPRTVSLNLKTSHGDLVVPEMDSDVVLAGHHGKLRLAGVSGDTGVDHHHGEVELGRIGGKLALNAHHSGVSVDEVVRDASVNAHHGGISLRRIGGDLALNSHHAPLDVEEVHGAAVINSHHAPLSLDQVLGDLTLNSNHGPVAAGQIGGNLHLSSSHGPVDIKAVSGDLSGQNHHAPLLVGSVGRSAVVRSTHGPLDLGPVQGDVTVEADRGAIRIGGAGGRVTVRASRGELRIENPKGEVMAENSRASIIITSDEAVRSAYTVSNNRGDVEIILPEGSDVDVQGFVRKGSIDTDLPLDVSANGQQGQSVNGKLGDGGPDIRAEVDAGRLILRNRQ